MSLSQAIVIGVKQAKRAYKQSTGAAYRAAQIASLRAAEEVADEMIRSAPVGPMTAFRRRKPNSQRISTSIVARKLKRRRVGELAAAAAKALAGHSHLVESGTAVRGRTTKGGASTGRIIARPFAAPAAARAHGRAMTIFRDEFKKELALQAEKIAAANAAKGV